MLDSQRATLFVRVLRTALGLIGDNMHYAFLAVAIAFEVIATLMLK
jgi:hypothetical protein